MMPDAMLRACPTQCTYERTHALNEELGYHRGHLAFSDALTRGQTKSGASA